MCWLICVTTTSQSETLSLSPRNRIDQILIFKPPSRLGPPESYATCSEEDTNKVSSFHPPTRSNLNPFRVGSMPWASWTLFNPSNLATQLLDLALNLGFSFAEMIDHGSSSFDYRSIREAACNAGAGATAGSVSILCFLVCLVGSCVFEFGFVFLLLFRGDCSDFCLPVRCDQDKVASSWSPWSSSLWKERYFALECN